MIKTVSFFLDILIFCASILFLGCVSENLYTHDDIDLLPENESQDDNRQQPPDEPSPDNSTVIEEIFSVTNSLDDIVGTWKIAPDNDVNNATFDIIETFQYPVHISNKNYMVMTFSKQDMTSFFKEEAARQKISEENLWEKRYSIPIVFRNSKTEDTLPFSDRHGTQTGIRWTREFSFYDSPKYFMQKEFLVPEFIVSQNLKFFLLSGDNDAMKINENSRFRYFSEKFEDLMDTSNFIYERLKNDLN